MDITSKDILVIQEALPKLQNLIENELGFKPNLKTVIRGQYINIISDDLMSELGNTLVKTLFTSIGIVFSGGNKFMSEDKNYIGFTSNLKYTHPNGGSNGVNFIWWSIILNLDTKEWVTKIN
jgi:hypothetical protein